MADGESPLAQVDRLLQQRAQYEAWLQKLTAAGSAAPESVRSRVRGDYEARLQSVVTELRTHAATVDSSLREHRSTLAALEARRSSIEERLAEAELRFAVGEYTDEEWSSVGQEAQDALGEIAQRTVAETGEIDRLAEVQRLISAPVKAEPSPPPAPEPVRAPSPDLPAGILLADAGPSVGEVPPAAPVVGAPKFTPKTPVPGRAPALGRSGGGSGMDELAFLKSVTGDESKRRQVAARKPDAPTEPAAESVTSDAGGGKAAATPTAAKTLKCGECGTLNRPTEWYCERCGAELAAL